MNAAPNAGALGASLAFLCIFMFIGAFIGAIFLRAACSLFNKFSGLTRETGGVPEPGYGHALAITFVTVIIHSVVGFFIGFMMSIALGVGQPGHVDPRTAQLLVQLVALPIGFLVSSAVIAVMLPTSYVRALLIALLQFVIALCIGLVLGGFVFVIILLFLGRGLRH